MGNYISVVQTATYLRAVLKRSFPGTKFSVRAESYSMGASIRVDWVDGPEEKAVSKIARDYEGSGFDGMIDMKYHYTSWMMPDGTSLGIANSEGTVGSRGMNDGIHNPKPNSLAIEVSFGADHVSCHRQTAAEKAREFEYTTLTGAQVIARLKKGETFTRKPERHSRIYFADGRYATNKIVRNLMKKGVLGWNTTNGEITVYAYGGK